MKQEGSNMRVNLHLSSTVLATMLLVGQVNAQSIDQPLDRISPITLTDNDLANGASIALRGAFENVSWQGDLFAYDVTSNGAVTGPLWSAATKFSEAEKTANYWQTRKIVFGATSGGQLFIPDNLTGMDQSIVNFVRGDRSNETKGMRQRGSLLGAIIRSNPVYVGEPNPKTNIASRTPYVYVGANDGMLHGFNAATGSETWAYIPSMLLASLPNLAAKPYTPTYYVDGALNAQDAQFDGNWHTVLVGGLGAGGKGLFAVNVTKPDDQKVLWELGSDGDTDMGHIFGASSIVKLNDNKWYAANGNGFNSTNGNAVLYLADIKTGAVKKITTADELAPTGLSAPTFVDVDSDGKADLAYAGDLQGDMWRFNLKIVNSITVQKVYDGSADQPISTAPDVAEHSLGGYWVLFGTGRSYVAADIDTKVQAIYGIRDELSNGDNAIVSADDLLERTLIPQK
jgi:Tfp pilus tip-associated adhesin PilY1